jgi:hypothetical protein
MASATASKQRGIGISVVVLRFAAVRAHWQEIVPVCDDFE